MKKRFWVLVIILIAMLAIGGCNTAKPESSDASSPTPVQSETPSSPAQSENMVATLENFHITITTDISADELLYKYDSYYKYSIDESGFWYIIWTDTEVKDFALFSIDWDDTEGEFSFFAGDILASVDELSPEKPFVAEMWTPETVPLYGISYLDENNVTRYFAICAGSGESNEGPPYVLREFENGKGMLD